jgi:hypothetical protein
MCLVAHLLAPIACVLYTTPPTPTATPTTPSTNSNLTPPVGIATSLITLLPVNGPTACVFALRLSVVMSGGPVFPVPADGMISVLASWVVVCVPVALGSGGRTVVGGANSVFAVRAVVTGVVREMLFLAWGQRGTYSRWVGPGALRHECSDSWRLLRAGLRERRRRGGRRRGGGGCWTASWLVVWLRYRGCAFKAANWFDLAVYNSSKTIALSSETTLRELCF